MRSVGPVTECLILAKIGNSEAQWVDWDKLVGDLILEQEKEVDRVSKGVFLS